MYPFGQEFIVNVYAWNDGQLLQNIPAQTITTYLFRTQPNFDEALAGTGALATISTTYTSGDIALTVPAIDCPNDMNAVDANYQYDYWLAINFVLESSEQTQTIIRAIQLQTVHLTDQTPNVTAEDIKTLCPRISTYFDDDDLAAFIATASELVQEALRKRNLAFNFIGRLDRLQPLIKFKAIELAYSSEIQGMNDKFSALAAIYRDGYENALGGLKVEYGLMNDTASLDVKQIATSITVQR